MDKIRIINDTTGEVKFVTSQVAKDSKTLKNYGFRIQHLGEKKEFNPIPQVTAALKEIGQRERYKELFGKYPAGRMKPETIASKIQKAETKLN